MNYRINDIVEGNDTFEYDPVSPAAFFGVPDTTRWMVDGVLLEGEAAAICAPKKCLATTTTIDLAVSVASGTPFLGHFATPQRRRVAYLSGPARQNEVRSKARRVCAARSLDPVACDIDWQFHMPRGGHPADLDRLAAGLERWRVGLVIIDPLFLLLRGCPDVSASNVYEIGAVFESAAESCLRAGATPVLVHHAVKAAGRTVSDRPLSLEDLAFAGIGEVARQWVLLNRAAEFAPATGRHELNMAVGGSTGNAAAWRLVAEEGAAGLARGWRVQVEPHGRKEQPVVAPVDGNTTDEFVREMISNIPARPPKKRGPTQMGHRNGPTDSGAGAVA
jgi:hypothetical protein